MAQGDIAQAERRGATRIRGNQQKVNATGERIGVNRPDVQYTDASGRRIYMEYDVDPVKSAVPHALRLMTNDPGRVLRITTPRPRAPRPPDGNP